MSTRPPDENAIKRTIESRVPSDVRVAVRWRLTGCDFEFCLARDEHRVFGTVLDGRDGRYAVDEALFALWKAQLS